MYLTVFNDKIHAMLYGSSMTYLNKRQKYMDDLIIKLILSWLLFPNIYILNMSNLILKSFEIIDNIKVLNENPVKYWMIAIVHRSRYS